MVIATIGLILGMITLVIVLRTWAHMRDLEDRMDDVETVIAYEIEEE